MVLEKKDIVQYSAKTTIQNEAKMKLEVAQNYTVVLKEVFNPIILETEEGNQLVVCMRDDTIEMTVPGSDRHWRADMETGEIVEM